MLRGDIYLANLPKIGGSIQDGIRPVIIFSNNYANRFSPVIHVIPMSSSTTKRSLPTHVEIPYHCGTIRSSIALCEQTMPICKDNLVKRVGRCDELTMNRIDIAISIQMGLVTSYTDKNKIS